MKKFTIIIIAALLITFSGCSAGTDNKPNFDVVSNRVEVWDGDTGEHCLKLIFEVSNPSNKPLHLKASDFDIMDESGNPIDVMKQVSAYPPIIEPGEVAVYYDAKISDKVLDANMRLNVIPHIESEKSKVKLTTLSMKGISGWRGENAIGTVKNPSSRKEYNNVQIAIICRKDNNEVASVMTATIDSIKPGEYIEFAAKDRLIQRNLGSNVVTTLQNFAYVLP